MGTSIIEQILKYFWVVTIVFLAAAGILSAQLTSDLIARNLWVAEIGDAPAPVDGAEPVARARLGDYRVIQQRNLFNAHPKPPPTAATPAAAPVEAAAPPPAAALPLLQLTLLGTAVVEDGQSLAMIELERELKVVREGQAVTEGAILSQVLADRIRVDRQGTIQEYLLYPPVTAAPPPQGRRGRSPPPPPEPVANAAPGEETVRTVGEDKWLIDSREVEEATANMSRLLTQVRVVPNFTDGQPDGFKVFAIRPGSLFAKIGLQNGDVLKRINGVEISGPEQAFEAYQRLKDETSIQIDLSRNNENRSFAYEIR